MRRALGLFVTLLATAASAQTDARMVFLTKQLSTAKDPRVRAQMAVILGASKDKAAIGPLCSALLDAEVVVRSAAAKALGELNDPRSIACLKQRAQDPSADVRVAISRALDALGGGSPRAGSLYVSIEPVVDKSTGFGSDIAQMADELLRSKLSQMGAFFAPPGETKAKATSLVRSKKLRGYLFKLNLLPHNNGGLRVDLLVLTYPDQAIQGSWNVKASGAKPSDLLKLMIPKVVDDAAQDLEWN